MSSETLKLTGGWSVLVASHSAYGTAHGVDLFRRWGGLNSATAC
jgi:hypothetical protein